MHREILPATSGGSWGFAPQGCGSFPWWARQARRTGGGEGLAKNKSEENAEVGRRAAAHAAGAHGGDDQGSAERGEAGGRGNARGKRRGQFGRRRPRLCRTWWRGGSGRGSEQDRREPRTPTLPFTHYPCVFLADGVTREPMMRPGGLRRCGARTAWRWRRSSCTAAQ